MCDYKTNKKNHLDRHIESHLKVRCFVMPLIKDYIINKKKRYLCLSM